MPYLSHLFPRDEGTRQEVAAVPVRVRGVHVLDRSSRWRPQELLSAGGGNGSQGGVGAESRQSRGGVGAELVGWSQGIVGAESRQSWGGVRAEPGCYEA